MVDMDEVIRWHNDGHIVTLQLNKSALEIVEIECPNRESEKPACSHDDVPCVVEYFLQIYGFDCNVGVVAPSGKMQFAWAFVGDEHKDLGACQVWVIPADDEAFAAWMTTQ
jgi:hypothetical protein